MRGFCINNLDYKSDVSSDDSGRFVYSTVHCGKFIVQHAHLKKFSNDNVLYSEEGQLFLLNGALLNNKILQGKYDCHDLLGLLKKMYAEQGEEFFEEFRGSFSGAYVDSEKKRLVAFTNHCGDGYLYYYCHEGRFIVASRQKEIVVAMRKKGIPYTLNPAAAHDMLTFGYMSDDKTYINEVQRVLPGHYLVIDYDDNYMVRDCHTECYWKIRTDYIDLTESSDDELFAELDKRFAHAVRLEYDKDLEYGYRHYLTLSGGLDSRMALWTACELGYKDMLCMTCGQTGSIDCVIATNIAKYWGLDIFFWPLESARHMMHIDEYTEVCQGVAFYNGIGPNREIYKLLDMEKFGLAHSGQIGDVVIGTFINNLAQVHDMSAGGLYSGTVEANPGKIASMYDLREAYLMMVRAFLGCLGTHAFTQEYTCVGSPFLDKDVFEFCLSIPVEKRINHEFYKKWILAKHPEAAKFPWERIGMKIDASRLALEYKKNLGRARRVLNDPSLVLKKLGILLGKSRKLTNKLTTGMNPFDRWWQENDVLRKVFNSYYAENREIMKYDRSIYGEVSTLYESGTVIDKTLALSAIAATKLFAAK